MDNFNVIELNDEADLSQTVLVGAERRTSIEKEPSNFKIVAVQSLAGNDNFAQNFLSDFNDEIITDAAEEEEIRPKLKVVPIATLKSPVIESPENKFIECRETENSRDADEETSIKRFRSEKLNQISTTTLVSKVKPLNVGNKAHVNDDNDGEMRPSGSSRRKSRITTRNADCDELSLTNAAVLNAVREEQVRIARKLPQGSKTELELMRNVAFLRVCVNHILAKIGRRPIKYDRNNQTLASLIHKYAKS